MTDKASIARALREIAAFIEIERSSPFKARAFRDAAKSVEAIEGDLTRWVDSGRMNLTQGIGKSIGPVIAELVHTGHSAYLEELRARNPAGVLDLSHVPSLGAKRVALLHEVLGITSVADLERACVAQKVRGLPGFGEKVEREILESIAAMRTAAARLLLPQALEIAGGLAAKLTESVEGSRVEVAGAVRRRLEIIDRIDLVIATENPAEFIEGIAASGLASPCEVVAGRRLVGLLAGRMPLVLCAVEPKSFGAAMLVHTGCEAFVADVIERASARGLALSDEGLRRGRRLLAAREEADVFRQIGLEQVAPEMREDPLALDRPLVRLIERSDLTGTFHVHSTWSDGHNTVSEMLSAARDRGFAYTGMSDHSKSATYAGGLDEMRVELQRTEISTLRPRVAPMHVFHGTEADILGDGSIDYGDAFLAKFDFVVASIHSRFKMDRDAMTERVVTALRNPHVTFLGHPTGRMLLSRDGYELDFARIFATAAECGVVIEINGSPRRLDLDWRLMRQAVDAGVMLAIHPDAHAIRELDWVDYGVWAARKGGLEARHVLNTRPLEEIADYLAKRKERARNF